MTLALTFQTSAPSIVHVDEFHEELSMAERRKREAEERLKQVHVVPGADVADILPSVSAVIYEN